MGILSITTSVAGQTGGLIGGVIPKQVSIVTTDNLATVTTAGYLAQANLQGYVIQNTDIINMWYGATGSQFGITSPGTFSQFTASIVNGIITLVTVVNPGDVLLPVVGNHIAIFNGTTGQITGDLSPAINGGNIQAGLSGTAGKLTSFPSTATTGSLSLTAVANSGNFANTISNASTGQATTWSLADPGGATANILEAPAALVSGNLVQASGTAGLVVDSGLVAANIQQLTQTFTLNQAAVQGAFATPVALIPAPGAGKVIIVNEGMIYTNFQTSAFAGGGVAVVQYANTVHGAGTNALAATIPAAEITAAASQVYVLNGNTANALTGITNTGLFFSNQTGAFTGGSASSTVVITLNYTVITATV